MLWLQHRLPGGSAEHAPRGEVERVHPDHARHPARVERHLHLHPRLSGLRGVRVREQPEERGGVTRATPGPPKRGIRQMQGMVLSMQTVWNSGDDEYATSDIFCKHVEDDITIW